VAVSASDCPTYNRVGSGVTLSLAAGCGRIVTRPMAVVARPPPAGRTSADTVTVPTAPAVTRPSPSTEPSNIPPVANQVAVVPGKSCPAES
jgi:hypothetical protein